MQPREKKEHISYDKIVEFVTLSDKYKKLHYQIYHFPDFRTTMIDKLLLAVLNSHFVENKIPKLKYHFQQIRKVIDNAKHHNLSVSDFYELIYVKLLNKENIKQLYSEIDKSLETKKITLGEHLLATEVLRKLELLKPKLSMKSHEEKLFMREEKYSEIILKPLHEQALQKFIKQFKMTDYFTQVVNGVYKAPETGQCVVSVLDELKAELSKLAPYDLKAYIALINKYHKELPSELNEKITEEMIIAKIQASLDEEKPLKIESIKLDFLLDEKSMRYEMKDQEHFYHSVSIDIAQLLSEYQKLKMIENHSGYQHDVEPPRDLFLTEYMFNLVKDSPKRDIYLLAYLIRSIYERYIHSHNQIDQSISWLNTVINKYLIQSDFKPDALSYVSKVALSILLKYTDPDLIFKVGNSNMTAYRAGYYIPESYFIKSAQSLPYELRKKFNEYTVNTLEKTHNIADDDQVRKNLLKDLSTKESQYILDLQRAFSLHAMVFKVRPDLISKLLLRLVAVDYLRKKIQSGDKLYSRQIRDEMHQLFGDLIFETRGCRASHITKIVNRLDLPESKNQGVESSLIHQDLPNDKRTALSNPSNLGIFKKVTLTNRGNETNKNLGEDCTYSLK